jgi:hypothetical protein
MSRWHEIEVSRTPQSDNLMFPAGWTAPAKVDAPGIRLEERHKELQT